MQLYNCSSIGYYCSKYILTPIVHIINVVSMLGNRLQFLNGLCLLYAFISKSYHFFFLAIKFCNSRKKLLFTLWQNVTFTEYRQCSARAGGVCFYAVWVIPAICIQEKASPHGSSLFQIFISNYFRIMEIHTPTFLLFYTDNNKESFNRRQNKSGKVNLKIIRTKLWLFSTFYAT